MKTMRLTAEEKRVFWSGHVERWRESGLSRTKYCKQNDLNLSQLVYWLQKSETAASEPKPIAFVRVNTVEDGKESAGISNSHFRLQLDDSLFLHWQGEADPEYIHRLMKALSA